MANTKPLASQVRYGRYNATTTDAVLKKSVLSYDTLSDAQASASNLPDDQVVLDREGQSEYKVSSGGLIIVKRDAFDVYRQGAGRGDAVKDLEVFRKAALVGGKIVVPAAEYTINGTVSFLKGTQLILENGAVIYVDTGSGDSAFVFQGAGRGTKVTLTADALKIQTASLCLLLLGSLSAVGC